MQTESTLLFNRSDVQELLSLAECIDVVEKVFRQQGEGKTAPSGILGVRTQCGGLHVKTACLSSAKNYVVAKLNTNFPRNYARFGKPTIQGVIVVYDADNGQLLAVLDSIEITIKRTAAATAVAAKFLARKNCSVATICGCGEQGRAQIRALSLTLPLRTIFAFDIDPNASFRLAAQLSREFQIDIEPVRDLPGAIRSSDVVVTCTPATEFFVQKNDIAAGTFIAAVGADDSHKHEIDPALMSSAKVVADSVEQVCAIGDTHHAIAAGLMCKENIYANLSEIVAGRKPGRLGDDEITIFDSTGVATEDAAAATLVYEKARSTKTTNSFEFAA
jgi:ornithine cyclodeaminase/alanine dehydrogenase-like protein (mu-crystallin family)